jgi:hypothetical protein
MDGARRCLQYMHMVSDGNRLSYMPIINISHFYGDAVKNGEESCREYVGIHHTGSGADAGVHYPVQLSGSRKGRGGMEGQIQPRHLPGE